MRTYWRRRGVGLVIGLGLAGTAAGCSMHPLPGDFSRKSTYDIVEKIRCEGAEALRDIPPGHPFLKSVYIGYDFDFNITETNGLGSADNAHLLSFQGSRPSGRTVTLDVSANASLSRVAHRTFRVVESLEKLRTADCTPGRAHARPLYPITGSIGMGEIVRTYVGLERITTLGTVEGTSGIPGAPSDSPVVFSDVLTFTTTLGASADTTLTLSAVGVGSFKLTGASLFGNASRSDTHMLTVAIARDPDPVEPPSQRSRARSARSTNTESREQEYREAIKSYQTNPTSNLSNNLVTNNVLSGPNSTSYIRTLDALQQKRLPADTRVFVELERLRNKLDEDKFIDRIVELLKP
jgi:hypothetical protein